MSVTINLRMLAAFATGLAFALIGVFVLQAWRVDAAPGDADATFVPMTPCRLIDTRPGDDRVGPLGAFGIEATQAVQARGTNGDCTIPAEAVGLSLNVTALGATEPSFLTVWPDGTRPKAASLNPIPDQPPTPNAVTTNLSGTGAFNVFNLAGTVDVVVDVNGFYTRSSLQQLQSQIDALKATDIALEAAQPFAVSAFNSPTIAATVSETPTAFVSLSVTAPVAGQVTLTSTTNVFESFDGKRVACAIYETADIPALTIVGSPSSQGWQTGGLSRSGTLSGTETFDIAGGATVSYSLACEARESSDAFLSKSGLVAIFTPAP